MKPFLQGKKSLSIAPLRPPHAHVQTHSPKEKSAQDPSAQPGTAGWSVEVIKEGDKVTRILVTCSCGESTEITCLYPAG
jgi:hypothetical protein